MSTRAPRRTPTTVVLPMGLVARVVLVVVLAVGVIGLIASGIPGRVASGVIVADGATVTEQRSVAERDISRGYEQATDHVRQARALKLAIPAAQADTIANKALADLFTLRHSALLSVAQVLGATTDAAEAYAKSTEQALDAKRGQPQPSTDPVLLAPRFYAIVARFNDLATQLADQATTDLTQSPSPPPTVAPTPTPRATPSPSPTR